MKLRRLIEALLALPATALYGVPALIGVPMVALFALPAAVAEPSVMILYLLIFFLLLSALLGLAALWISIFGGLVDRPGLLSGGLLFGLVGAGGFVAMTFSNDRFDIAETWTFNSSFLWPLLLVIPVGVSRLLSAFQARH